MINDEFTLFFDYLDKGGLVFLILLLFSTISISIILLKVFQFIYFNSIKVNDLDKQIIRRKQDLYGNRRKCEL